MRVGFARVDARFANVDARFARVDATTEQRFRSQLIWLMSTMITLFTFFGGLIVSLG